MEMVLTKNLSQYQCLVILGKNTKRRQPRVSQECQHVLSGIPKGSILSYKKLKILICTHRVWEELLGSSPFSEISGSSL